jgi:Carboxypeptidase regulatory-like domain
MLCVAAVRARAQAGAATDVIIGRVTDSTGTPLAQATVTATAIATGLARATVTGDDGRYRIVFAEGGGRYVIRVRRLGYAPATVGIERRAETDRLALDITLATRATALSAVTVRAASSDSIATVNGTGRTLTPTIVNRLPIDVAGDLAALAALSPGVVATAATDTTASTFSVGGQRPTQNHLSLDGLTFTGGVVPRDAVRETKIVTSTYDVSKGQFSGGEVAATTRSGGNTPQLSLTYDLQPPWLQVGAAPSAAYSREYSLNRLSVGLGGPIVHDKLFGFFAVEVSHKTNPLATLLSSDPTTDERLGVSPAAVQQFTAAVQQFGLPLYPAGVPVDQTQDKGSAIARVDYLVDPSNHLTVRADYHGLSQEGTRANPRGLLTYLGKGGAQGGGLLAGLTTEAGPVTNDARLTGQYEWRRQVGYGFLPRGRVFITSTMSDGSVSTFDVSAGGNQDFPWSASTGLLEGGDEVAWLSPGGGHRLKVGALFDYGTARTDSTEQKDGVFIYNTLADFQNNAPASFTRVLGAGPRNSSRDGEAFYAGDAWQPRRGLEIDYGARVEGSQYGDAPALNPAIQSVFGLRTDRYPSEWQISPRLGFTYSSAGDEAGAGASGLTLRGGIGEFRGVIPPFLFSEAAQSNGLPGGQTLLTCTGASVPTPNWAGYLANAGSIPTTCAGGTTGTSGALPSVVVFGPHTSAPRVWRASLGASHRLFGPISGSLDVFYIRGMSQLGLPDINLDTVPKFRLSNEGNRPVYVSASSIDPTTGAVSINASRLHSQFGPVSEVISSLQSETRQIIVGLSGETGSGATIDVSYTYTNARDQSLGFDGESADGSAGGNPNRPTWGTADEERRHQVLATVVIPVRKGVELTAIGHLVSGLPFTPAVGEDMNGDGQRNDRAFVFNPATTIDTGVANGMRRLLANGPPTARQCLPSQFGQVAGRNSCFGPWVPDLDLKINVRPLRWLTLGVTAFNTLVGLDELLHGSNHLAGWGQDATIDRRLLYVTGFNPSTNNFQYQVNQHFGAASGALNPFRTPFVIGLQGRVKLGGGKGGDD